jgi:acyl carrier protein
MNEAAVLSEAEIVDRTRAYVRDAFLYMRPDRRLKDDAPLVAGGVIDSMGVVELIAFLQQTFGVTVSEDEITEHNLGTLAPIGRFVRGKARGTRMGGTSARGTT